jgi:hypothetical protein
MFSEEFYPTPRAVARTMLKKISSDAKNILEPQAGKGDLAEVARGLEEDGYDSHGTWRTRNQRKVDCIELNPELAQILVGKGFPVVGYDWLTYTGVSYYDAIVMNPPFSNGDQHLLKAWEFLHDGEIVCLLNEETVKNPSTKARQRLAEIIAKHGEVQYLGECFRSALRETNVGIAMVYLKKTSDDDRIELWATPTREKAADEAIGDEAEQKMLAIRDELGNMEHYYSMANEHMLKAFQHIRKAALYLEANGIDAGYSQDYAEILKTALRNNNTARAEFGRKHRRDAWYRVFAKMDFHKWLDKKQSEELLRDVEVHGNIQFTADNIRATLDNVFSQRRRLFEQSVANVFDSLTSDHKKSNRSEGWKTNDGHKVNQKLIFPWGCQWDNIFNKFELRYSGDIDIYNDLDRVLAVLNGDRFEEILTIGAAMKRAFEALPRHATRPNKCRSSFFDVEFYKKGTVHLKFRDAKLWERFNVTAAAGKKWVGQNTNKRSEWPGRPPEYGVGD